MGHVSHNAIVVTSWDELALEDAYTEAKKIGLHVTPAVTSTINGYRSFLVVPDGSKSGWEADEEGDGLRAEFKSILRASRHDDGSSPLEWAEVEYGSDDHDAKVVDHEWVGRNMTGGEDAGI